MNETRTRSRRSFAWLGAVVLFVFIATAGLPAARSHVAPASRIEVVEGMPVLRLAAGEHRGGDHSQAPVLLPLPRALPRTRSVASRGLPPPRAPTC